MSFSTVYDVKVRYSVDNRAGRSGTVGLTDDVKQLDRQAKTTTGSFARMGLAVVGAIGARTLGKAMVGFNSSVEDTKLQIAGMLALARKTDLVDQVSAADRVYANLQKRAASLPGTTMEYAKMAGMLTQPIVDAGLQMKDLEDITVNAVVGAKALGVEWEVAGRDIDQALRGQFHSTDVFTGKLLGSMGYKGEEGRAKYNALNAEKRADELKRALLQPQLTQLAAAQGATFSGMLSTLQDSLEQTVGKVGLPLFQAITVEIKNWNKWIDANARRINEVAHSVGEGLVTGFGAVKDALTFLVNHADLLTSIGKVWLAVKVGGLLQSGVKAGGGALGAASSSMAWGARAKDGFDPETGGYTYTRAGKGRQNVTMGNIGGSLPLIGQSLAVGYAFGTIIDRATGLSHGLASLALDKTSLAFEKIGKAGDALTASLQRAAGANPNSAAAMANLIGVKQNYADQANLVRDLMRAQQGLTIGSANTIVDKYKAVEAAGIGEDDYKQYGGMRQFADAMSAKAEALGAKQLELGIKGTLAFEVGIRALTDYQRATLDEAKAQQDLLTYINQSISKGIPLAPATIMEILRADTADPSGTHKAMADKPKVTVHINRIEVQSDDPDRMAFGLIESFRDAAKNPSSAFATLREG